MFGLPLEFWSTVATLATFVVIAVTAITAVIQLRHIRGSNQIAGLNQLQASQQTPQFVSALQFVYSELPEKLQDPVFRYQLAHRAARTSQYNDALSQAEAVGDAYERIGMLARNGLIDRGLLMDIYPSLVMDAWSALADVTAILRTQYGLSLWENFEYLAVISQDWDRTHKSGSYPRSLRRINLPNKWHDADERFKASLIGEARDRENG